MENTNKKMKKGITLIEIILAIVLIAIILGITIPKLMSNSQQAEVKQVITNDVKAILESAALWRKQTIAATGSFKDVAPGSLQSTLPTNMTVNNGYIYSSGLRTGNTDIARSTGVRYTVRWHIDTTNTDTGTFSITMESTEGQTLLGWDAKIVAYARESFVNAVHSISPTAVENTTAAVAASTSPLAGAATCTNTTLFGCFDSVNVR